MLALCVPRYSCRATKCDSNAAGAPGVCNLRDCGGMIAAIHGFVGVGYVSGYANLPMFSLYEFYTHCMELVRISIRIIEGLCVFYVHCIEFVRIIRTRTNLYVLCTCYVRTL